MKAKAQNMMNKIDKTKSKYEKAKNDTKKLIESVREYLSGKISIHYSLDNKLFIF